MNNTNNIICNCNHFFNEETKHPLITVVDLAQKKDDTMVGDGFYAIVLNHFRSDEFRFGRQMCDFSDATLRFFSPKSKMDFSSFNKEGVMVAFQQQMLQYTHLGQVIKNFNFFDFNEEKEGLNLSEYEQKTIKDLIDSISKELSWGIDNSSKTIISNYLEQIFNYSQRYYHRQFISRHNTNVTVIENLNKILENYYLVSKHCKCSRPQLDSFLDENNLSDAYFNELLKYETGKDFTEYLKFYRIELSKRLLMEKKMSIEDIANKLLFCSTSCFTSLFTKLMGVSPEEYRNG